MATLLGGLYLAAVASLSSLLYNNSSSDAMSQFQREAVRRPLGDLDSNITALREAEVQLARRCQASRRRNECRQGEIEQGTAGR